MKKSLIGSEVIETERKPLKPHEPNDIRVQKKPGDVGKSKD